MATVEIDENDLVNYRNITAAVQRMLANPQTRGKLLEAQKILNPNAVIPEIDSAKPIYDAIGKVSEELKSLKEQREADAAEIKKEKAMAELKASWESGRMRARRAGYTDDGLEALEKFMEEKGLADHEIAMAAFEKLNPPQNAVDATGSQRFDIFGPKSDEDTKMLFDGNDQQFLNKRIKDTLAAVRSGNF